MVGLGDLPGGDFFSVANDVSDDGSIIVGFSHTGLGNEAFVWDASTGMHRLQDLLTSVYGLDLSGWSQLFNANGVSRDGTHIVGSGRHNGNTEAFLVTIPEWNAGVLTAMFVVTVLPIILIRPRSH